MPIYDIELPAHHGSRRSTPKPCIGPRYTTEQELDIRRAMLEAERYMQNYGKGFTPAPIDKSHYILPIDSHANKPD